MGEGSETVQTVIVPEQTVTISESQQMAILTGVDTSFFGTLQNGDAVPFVVDGTTYNGIARIREPSVLIGGPDAPFSITYFSEDVEGISAGTYFRSESAGTYTVSITASTPKVEPKWEAARGELPELPPDDGTYVLRILNGVASWAESST